MESNVEGAKEQKLAILASFKWGEGWPDLLFILPKIEILDSIKWNNYSPSPQAKAVMKARRSKNAPFWHHWNGGRGGADVPFILSKAVGLSRSHAGWKPLRKQQNWCQVRWQRLMFSEAAPRPRSRHKSCWGLCCLVHSSPCSCLRVTVVSPGLILDGAAGLKRLF